METKLPDQKSERHCVSDDESAALLRLGNAIPQLGGNTAWILDSLAETLGATKSVHKKGLTNEQKQLLVETDAFTSGELDQTMLEVDRDSLQVSAAEAFLSHFHETLPFPDTVGYLDWTEDAMRRAVVARRLCAVEISDRLRFPSWQFSGSDADGLLPGLAALLRATTNRWDWLGVGAIMSTPQQDVVMKGRQTPAEWLRRGGSIANVGSIIDAWEWL